MTTPESSSNAAGDASWAGPEPTEKLETPPTTKAPEGDVADEPTGTMEEVAGPGSPGPADRSSEVDWFSIAAGSVLVASLGLLPLHLGELWDVPAHAFLLHPVVTLLPLVSVAAIVLAWHRGWRRRFGPALVVSALVALVVTELSSGAADRLSLPGHVVSRALVRRGGPALGDYVDAAQRLPLFIWLLTAAAVGMVALDRFQGRRQVVERVEAEATSIGTEGGTEEAVSDTPAPVAAPVADGTSKHADVLTAVIGSVVTLLAVMTLVAGLHVGRLADRAAWSTSTVSILDRSNGAVPRLGDGNGPRLQAPDGGRFSQRPFGQSGQAGDDGTSPVPGRRAGQGGAASPTTVAPTTVAPPAPSTTVAPTAA